MWVLVKVQLHLSLQDCPLNRKLREGRSLQFNNALDIDENPYIQRQKQIRNSVVTALLNIVKKVGHNILLTIYQMSKYLPSNFHQN